MAAPEAVHAPPLGEPGEPCPQCGSPLALDQRYCLECGARRADARLPFLDILRARSTPPAEPGQRRLRLTDSISGGTAALGVALAVLFLAVGVLVGRSGGGDKAAAPSVVTVGGGAGTAAGASGGSAGASFSSDWPAGQSGWTVQLQALPKPSNDAAKVQAAKAAAKGKGAPDVGALDSDDFGSLTPGQYVVYSGRFKTKAQATKALGKLRGHFPQAKVVHVAAGGAGPTINSAKAKRDKQTLQRLQGLSGSDYSKQSRKLPKTVELPGKAPPKDNKQGGGGSGFQTIG
jgi:hypothetical protein